MQRTMVAHLKSEVMNSAKDLSGAWNGNEFQGRRLTAATRVIDDCLVAKVIDVSVEGRRLALSYQQACERIGKDPLAFANRALELAKIIQSSGGLVEDRKELVAFCNVINRCFDYVLGR